MTDLVELAERCEKATDKGAIDDLCRELHEVDEHSNVNGSCAAYLYNLQDAKRFILEGHGYLLACDENRVRATIVAMGSDAIKGFSAVRPGAFAETRALVAAALRAHAAQSKGEQG
jgi:hypothetical protein